MAMSRGDLEPPWRWGEGTRSPPRHGGVGRGCGALLTPTVVGGGDLEPLMVVGWAGLHGEKDLKRGLAGDRDGNVS